MAVIKPLPPVQRVPMDSITIADNNPNDHPREQIDYFKNVLVEFGQLVAAVIDENRIIRKGTGLYLAMQELEATEIDVIQAPLDEIKGMAFAAIDNKLAELSKRNFQKMAEIMKVLHDDGFDIKPFGFKDHDISPLLEADWKPPEKEEMPAPPDKKTSYTFGPKEADTIERAAELVRLREDDRKLKVEQCIVKMAEEYLSERQYSSDVATSEQRAETPAANS
jgi:hypothetical protein